MRATAIRIKMAAALLCIAVGSARGDIIDQSYTPVTGQGYSTSYSPFQPLGQEFTPTLGSLDFVDLYLGDAGSDVGPGASFQVVIHSGSITGTILGTSDVASVPDNLNLGVGNYADFITTRFTFASSVDLTPGQTDVIEIIQLPPIVVGNFNFAAYGGPTNNSTYAGGEAVLGGVRQPGFDFAFREGRFAPAVPGPSSIVLCGLGLSLIGPARLRRFLAARATRR